LVFPAILRNDSHHQSDINKPEQITHIKMTAVGYKDLVQALKFPETRIRFPNEVPATPSPRILGMEIISADKKGFFKGITLAFSDNLSCLIGPRGSGKSTIIEALRYTLGLNQKLEEFEQAGAELASKAHSLQKATLTNCIIHVAYLRKDGRTQILESTYDSKQENMTKFYDVEGTPIEIVDIDSNFPVRLFGWSEIETLGREANRQRELLDRLIPELAEMLLSQKSFRQMLETKKIDIVYSVSKLVSFVQKDSSEIKKYREYKSDFEKLNTAEVDALFKDIDTAKNKAVVLKKVKNNIQSLLSNTPQSQAIELFDGINELLSEYPVPIKDWWVSHKEQNKLKERETEIREAMEKVRSTIIKFSDEMTIHINVINGELTEKESQLKEKIGEEASKQVAADLRRIAGERLQRVNQMRREYNEEWKRLEDRIKQWKDISLQLTDLQQRISEKRTKRKEEIETDLNKFNNPKMKISIRFKESADRKAFTAHLYTCGLLTKDVNARWRSNVWPEKISVSCTPVEFAQCMLSKTHLKLKESVTLDGKVFETEGTMAETLTNTIYPFGEDKDAEIPIVDKDLLEKILSSAEIEWNDEEGILLNEKPIENCSPGQRSSAMLPLIALVEDTPLIIDQPEDNLDNSLVGKVLVDILAGLKEKRQIIVATHNPNIVVSGDAEQVIVMDAISDSEGICKEMGSIDNQSIVKSVVDIMEGGKDAFINRFKRYGREVELEVP
jgi:ABC-type cobalamin/Fe3+-siderophores transport system ATPase subunit